MKLFVSVRTKAAVIHCHWFERVGVFILTRRTPLCQNSKRLRRGSGGCGWKGEFLVEEKSSTGWKAAVSTIRESGWKFRFQNFCLCVRKCTQIKNSEWSRFRYYYSDYLLHDSSKENVPSPRVPSVHRLLKKKCLCTF